MTRAAPLLGAICALWLGLTGALFAQEAPPAVLVADSVSFSRDGTSLEASGNVEVFFEGRLLRASSVRYNRATDQLDILGPITLIENEDTILLADQGALSQDLRGGLLRGARLVLDQHLQIAATEITREADGRYTQLYQTVASSCSVCSEDEVPLWQIRARRVIHDAEERQLYFENAQFRVAGLPIFYWPQLRLPDPTLDRATGFLVPKLISNSVLGVGLKTPYFFALDDHHDLTLTPYVTLEGAKTLEARYRRAYVNGWIEFNGAISDDKETRHDARSYLFGEGLFRLRRGYDLTFNLEAASDDAYLRLYDYSQKDRLQSRLAITKTSRDRFAEAEIIGFQSLRSADNNAFLPTFMTQVHVSQRFAPERLGGIGKWTLEAHGHYRRNDDPTLGGGPLAITARDVGRLSAALEWERTWVHSSGLVTTLQAAGYAEAYSVNQDPLRFANGRADAVTPYLGFEARLPLSRTAANGTVHMIEPVVQAVLAPDSRNTTPNEDSLSVEFDEANIYDFSRFTGRDARELGSRVNVGVSYTRYDANGWEAGLTVGRTFRARDLGQFNASSGLDDKASDWLLSGYYARGDTFRVDSRSLFDDGLSFSKSETILSWSGDRHSVLTGYTWLKADAAVGRPLDTSEWTMDADYDINENWTARADWQYDFRTNDASRAGLGLTYYSDCVRVDFDVERRFTSSNTLQPVTTYGVTVALNGFGASDRGKRSGRHTCY